MRLWQAAARAAALAAALLFATQPARALAAEAPPAAQPAAPVARADSIAALADTARSAPPADSARADTLATAGKRDGAGVITTRPAAPKRGSKKAPEPPYRIEAGKMSGGRGPRGDVLFLEKVTITRGRTRLQSERGRYERASGMVYLEQNVRLRDSSATVTCDEASFSETEDRLDLKGNVVVVDREATLKAPVGWYDRGTGIARLRGGVKGQEKQQRLVADEATYERDSMVVRARGNVVGDDDENRVRLEAGAVDFDRRTRVATATRDPLLRLLDDDNKETRLRARLLRVNAATKIAEAVDSVRVERDTLKATARYAVFNDSTGRGLLLGEPRAWDSETEIKGDTLETVAENRKLQRIIVHGDARIDYVGGREGNRGESSRLSGARVEMFVNESRVDSLIATGKASNAYTAVAKEGKTAEVNLARGDTIFVYFRDRKLDRARVQGGANGEYRPPVDVGDTTAARLERIAYEGGQIEFVIPRNEIVLDEGARLEYRDMELRSRRVVFDSEKKTLVAEGKPQLVEKEDEVTGNLMTYDMQQRVGTIYQATTEYEQALYHGNRIRKAADDQLDVEGGSYSTCDLDHPHYHFASQYMKVYLKDKLVAKPVVFYLRNVPILALPFYVFPIKPGRHSGFLFPQVEFGFNTTTGRFVRNFGYYWAPNDYFDITTGGDYYQSQPAWLLRGDMNYRLLYAFDGHVEGQYERAEDTGSSDWRLHGSHQQTFGQRTRLSALANFVSSREYSGSALSGQTIQQRLNRFLTSSVQMSHFADWVSLNAFVDRREDLDADVALEDTTRFKPGAKAQLPNLTMTLPSISASLPTRTIGSYAFIKDRALGKLLQTSYLTLNGKLLSQYTRFGVVSGREYVLDTLTVGDSTNVRDTVIVRDGFNTIGFTEQTRSAFSSNFALTDSRRLFGWISFAPSFSGQAVVFDYDNLGNKIVPAAVWQASLGTSTTLYRPFSTPIPSVAVRHVVSPTAFVNYSPEFPNLQYTDDAGNVHDRFTGFGDIGIFSGRKTLRATFALEQRLQAKISRGDNVRRLDNLLQWTNSTSYDFLYKENGLAHPLGRINSALRLQPPGWVNADATANIDVYNGRPLQAFNYNIGATFGSGGGGGRPQAARLASESPATGTPGEAVEEFRETWTASVAYSYAGGYAAPQKWSSREALNGTLRYQLTENWSFDYQAGYDITSRIMVLQRFNLTRRIHCWEAQFSRSFIPGGETEYFFRLGVMRQREIFYERGSRSQSFGGIQ